MVKVRFVNENKEVEIKERRSIAFAARSAGVNIDIPCQGAGSCGKCRVRISDLSAAEQLPASVKCTKEERDENIVLACHSLVIKDIDVYTFNSSLKEKNLKILEYGIKRRIDLDPAIKREYKYKDNKTVIYSDEGILSEEDGDTVSGPMYGIVADIGTTTVVCTLVCLEDGQEKGSVSMLNPQCSRALDVIGRIQYCSENDEGLAEMYGSVSGAIDSMAGMLCEKYCVDRKDIYEAVYSANTTMLHLAVNTDPYKLGQYPYVSAIKGNEYRSAAECGLNLAGGARVYLPPVISSYVGADITSGILSCSLEESKETILFIDIGTNGEMVLVSDGKMTATSTAAGPAFEGMNITFGMRAAEGAIESFAINEDYDTEVSAIGNIKPKGICGSGLFDIAGELVRTGIIEKTGKFVKPEKCTLPDKIKSRLAKYAGKAAFEVSEGVYLTLSDIRQIQLAKSAVRAGIEAMLALNGLKDSDPDRVYIAGSFGYHLKVSSLISTGIVPASLRDKIEFVGNTSKSGGIAFLTDKKMRGAMARKTAHVQTVELSEYKDFEKLFVKYMYF